MSYKNRAYSNKNRTGSKQDPVGHFYHANQQQQQDQLIAAWLRDNNIPLSQLKTKRSI